MPLAQQQPILSVENIHNQAFNRDAQVLGVMSGFLPMKVNRQIAVAYPNSTTETYTYKEGSTTLFVLTVVYTDSTKASISTVTRTS